jgi:hypothetical protein
MQHKIHNELQGKSRETSDENFVICNRNYNFQWFLPSSKTKTELYTILRDVCIVSNRLTYLFIFFYCSLSPFTVLIYQVPCGRLVFFPLFFLLCAAGLQGTFPGHPRPPSLLLFPFWATQYEIQHKHPWDLNPADLAVVSEECRSSFHHPTVSP